MYLVNIAHAVPQDSLTQSELWETLRTLPVFRELNQRSQHILRKVLLGPSGIEKRHFANADMHKLFGLGADELNQSFEKFAPSLASNALGKSLRSTNIAITELDALFVCSCTGYLCPGLSSYIAEQMGMRPDAHLVDLVGLGCGAAIPTLRSAHDFLRSRSLDDQSSKVAVVAVEICSSAFYLDNDPGVLISFCLFGDGASASIWSNEKKNMSGSEMPDVPSIVSNSFRTLHVPEKRKLLRFEHVEGKLKNRLHSTVPQEAAQAVGQLFQERSAYARMPADYVIVHPGGKKVIEAIECELSHDGLGETSSVLRKFGNMSSPSVLIVLEQLLGQLAVNVVKGSSEKEKKKERSIWMTSFGAGFTCHSCELCI